MAETVESLKTEIAAVKAATINLSTIVQQVIAADQAEDAAFQAEIDALKAQLVNGVPVSQADLDALGQDLAGQTTTLNDLATALGAIGTGQPVPPVTPPATP